MAKSNYNIGTPPPTIAWTVVRGDTASFKVYVTDDARQPLNIPDWTIVMEIRRGGVDGTIITTLYPSQDEDDLPGEFTVFMTSEQSKMLETEDVFDIELSLPQDQLVWTVARGNMVIIEDVTD